MATLIEQQLVRAFQLLSTDTTSSQLSKADILKWGFLIAHHIQRDPIDSLNALTSMQKLQKIHPFSQAEEAEMISRLIEDLEAPLHEESKEIEKSVVKTIGDFSDSKKTIAERSTSVSKRSSSDEKISPRQDVGLLQPSETVIVSKFQVEVSFEKNNESELVQPDEVPIDQIATDPIRLLKRVPLKKKTVSVSQSQASIPVQTKTTPAVKPKPVTKQAQPVQNKAYIRPTTATTAKTTALKKDPVPQKTIVSKKVEPTKTQPVVSNRPQTAPYKSTVADKKPSIVSRVPKKLSNECNICLEPFGDNPNKLHSIAGCRGKFHTSCFKSYLMACIESSNFPLKCPDVGCKNQIADINFMPIIPKTQYNLYKKRKHIKEAVDNPSKFTFCSTPNCEHIFTIPTKDSQAFAKCPKCQQGTCLFCKVKFHTKLTCKEYQTYKPEDHEVCKNLRENNWKKCLKCRFWIEKNEGCNHMTCKCGNEFCYVCGKKWHTCHCGS